MKVILIQLLIDLFYRIATSIHMHRNLFIRDMLYIWTVKQTLVVTYASIVSDVCMNFLTHKKISRTFRSLD